MRSSPVYRLASVACLCVMVLLCILRVRFQGGDQPSVSLERPPIAYGYGLIDLVCGNGKKEAGEECDDGNISNTDTCTVKCFLARCGDGYLQGTEQCEPPGQGTCSIFCIDPSKKAASASSAFTTRNSCGNNVVEPLKGEQCDLGVHNGLSPSCTIDCKKRSCGDGTIGPGEECEPPLNEFAEPIEPASCGKICRPYECKWEFRPACPVTAAASSVSSASVKASSVSVSKSSGSSSSPASAVTSLSSASAAPVSAASSSVSSLSSQGVAPQAVEARCGNARVEGLESCDDGNLKGGDGCSQICVLEIPGVPRCGDGIRDGLEECDLGDANSNALPDVCRLDCRLPRCGDAVVDATELCDDGNNVSGDACAAICIPSLCGDGTLEFGEECDDGDRNSDSAPDSCRLNCRVPRCGDGVTDAAFGEQCDDGDDADPSDGCHMCVLDGCAGDACHEAAPEQPAFEPLCLGDDCVTESPEAETHSPLLALLLVLELNVTVLLWRRIRVLRRALPMPPA